MPALSRNTDKRPLAEFLATRRAKIKPAEAGFAFGRRRTPGLRREEVAQIAGVSLTWYTWLEQGRDIRVSPEALEGISRALKLDRAEREHLFMLAHGRPPALAHGDVRTITPALQRMLDGLAFSPAYIKTARWDIVGWNRAAVLTFSNYAEMEPHERNSVWLLFCHPAWRSLVVDWEADAKRVLATFRAACGRAEQDPRFQDLIDELNRVSPEFNQWWLRHDVRSHGEGIKAIRHPVAGHMALEYTSFTVENEPDLSLVVYTAASAETASKIETLITQDKQSTAVSGTVVA